MSSELILVTGATGYIGGRLRRALEDQGRRVRCLARNPEFLQDRVGAKTEVVQGDAFDPESLTAALQGVTTALYNIHALGGEGDFEERDRVAARNFGEAAAQAGVGKIVYLGGLGKGENLSKHLASRQETGRELAGAGVPVLEFRASIVLGSGSLSFEMVRALVEKLPVMTTPKWVRKPAQPIGIEDVISYLLASVDYTASGHEIFEIGGADQVSYEGIMRAYARARGLRRLVVPVPLLTPRLSSGWLALVTPLYYRIGRWLIDGVKNATLADDAAARQTFNITPMGIDEAIRRALVNEDSEIAETRWSDAHRREHPEGEPGRRHIGTREIYSRSIIVHAPPHEAFLPIQYIGGNRGWYSYPWMWNLRGLFDKLVGGPGMSRGRRDPLVLVPGDVVDWWRVEALEVYRLLRLRAEMKLPGRGWLQFELDPEAGPSGESWTRVSVHAIFEPLGLVGRLYWLVFYPFHGMIFSKMLEEIRFFVEHGQAPSR